MHPIITAILLGGTCIACLAAEPPNKGGIKTIIEPGKQVILAIPFEPQERGGICAAGAAINILKFLNPELNITQEKLFSLFDAGRAGASPQQVIKGISTLGFTGTLVPIKQVEPDQLIGQIKASLDSGRPIIAASRNHAMVLYGYDNTAKKGVFYLWDQRKGQRKQPANGMPAGTTEIDQSKFMTRMEAVMFIKSNQP